MAYDFHGPWSEVTSFSSPLYSRGSNIRFNQQYSQQWAIDRWISGGAPRNKLVLGLTGIATTFTLANITDAGVGAAVAGAGKTGPYLGHEGHTTYYRVCELIRNGAVYRFDEEQKMSYVVLEDQWAGYPTPKSMKEKVRFAYSRGLAGTMFWSLEVDDFKGTYCNAGQFPLLTAVYDTIQEMAPYAASVPTMKSFCYFTNWSPKYANLDARMDVRDVNTSLCSHLVYAFADIDRQNLTLVKSQPDDDDGTVWTKRGRYFTFNKLKADCPGLKTLLSVGGAYGHGFPLVVANADAMRTFARNAALYARDRDFDGIDIDWEYPRKLYREKFLDLIKAWAIDQWISGGAQRDKLVLGLTGQALTFTLADPNDTWVGASVLGPGTPGPYLGVEGRVPYYRVCELIQNGAVHHFDEEQKMAYAVLGDQWIGYPTPDSMKEKVLFAHSRRLAGTMFWSLEYDDFLGSYCRQGEFPLLTAVHDAMQEVAASPQLPI
ncbi:CHIT1-like protein [Mya arenaria]|uniref:CHIT1-like protein n=1 Tax=Mya arenaria TaxID=6604 RepID=A0ABY7E1Y5_MYAAR|nr:CHIT1-like protein [Mya arenaria]